MSNELFDYVAANHVRVPLLVDGRHVRDVCQSDNETWPCDAAQLRARLAAAEALLEKVRRDAAYSAGDCTSCDAILRRLAARMGVRS